VQIVSFGEVLWDVFPDREFLGGAPLNFCAAAARLGNAAALLTAVGTDRRGTGAIEGMAALELTTEFVQVSAKHTTGAAIVVTDSHGNASYVIDRPAAFDDVSIDEPLLARLEAIEPDWLYFGTLAPFEATSEQALMRIATRLSGVRRFYDLNLRDGHWDLPLVQRLSGMATIMKLNETEAELLSNLTLAATPYSLEAFCLYWSALYRIETICVSLGSEGCAIFSDGTLKTYPGFPVDVVDTVGAGDAFSAALLHGFHLGWPVERTAEFANAVGATVASRAGATPAWTTEDPLRLIAV
jgi:fructokinase